MMLTKLIYYLKWFYQCRFRNKKIPLNSSIILTDQCNLSCKHCTVAHLNYPPRKFQDVGNDLHKLFALGSRMLVVTGGEPFLWRDGNYSLENVVRLAKTMGFFRVVVCTNGAFPLRSQADYLWVSLDGFASEHIELRGDIYTRVIQNITRSKHPRIYINFTISKINYNGFEKASEEIWRMRNVRGILFHLYTSYIGSNPDLRLTSAEKTKALERLLKIKVRHPTKVFNTFDGLRAMRANIWKRPVWSSMVINQGELGQCCCRKGIYDDAVCAECGCSPAAETYVLQQMRPLAILENMRFI